MLEISKSQWSFGASVPNYNQLNEWPLQFLRTGGYRRSYGLLNGRTARGYWWSSTASSTTDGRHLTSWAGNVYAQSSNFRGYGFALRCGEKSLRMEYRRP